MHRLTHVRIKGNVSFSVQDLMTKCVSEGIVCPYVTSFSSNHKIVSILLLFISYSCETITFVIYRPNRISRNFFPIQLLWLVRVVSRGSVDNYTIRQAQSSSHARMRKTTRSSTNKRWLQEGDST